MKGLLKILVIGLFLSLVLAPVIVSAVPDESAANRAPVAQPLVREGTLALKLAEALKLGTPANEAEAEAALVSAGIAPKNGWVGDYPVTPDIVGELQVSIGDAATAGRLTISQADAAKTYQDVLAGYNLAVSTAPEPEVAGEGSVPPEYPDAAAADNYYYDEGPPVVTYYAPPADYAYLYSWVPYPFWGWDFWFPGFFVLADFDIDIDHHHHHHDGHDGHHDGHDGHRDGNHDGHFSNHFRDSNRGTFSRIDPAQRANGGTLSDRPSRWTNATVQRSAAGIINRTATMGRNTGMTTTSGRTAGTGISSLNRRGVQSGSLGMRDSSNLSGTRTYTGRQQSYTRTPSMGSRSFNQPSYTAGPSVSRSFSQPSYRAPSASGSYSRPSMSTAPSGRSFSAPSGVSRGGGFSGGRSSFSGGGSFGGRGGGSFGGGGRR